MAQLETIDTIDFISDTEPTLPGGAQYIWLQTDGSTTPQHGTLYISNADSTAGGSGESGSTWIELKSETAKVAALTYNVYRVRSNDESLTPQKGVDVLYDSDTLEETAVLVA